MVRSTRTFWIEGYLLHRCRPSGIDMDVSDDARQTLKPNQYIVACDIFKLNKGY